MSNEIDGRLESRIPKGDIAVAIRAAHLRKTLLAKNHGEIFSQILASLSDQELVEMDAEHHAWRVAQFRVGQESAMIVTPAMREAACKRNARRGKFNANH